MFRVLSSSLKPAASQVLCQTQKASLHEAVIVSTARTPIGSFGGSMASITAPRLGAIAIRSAVQRAGIDSSMVEEAFLGNVLSAGQGQAPCRQAATFNAGLPLSLVCTTVNKVCASGMKSIMLAAQQVMLGQRSIVLAGGFESMSNVPYYLPASKARFGGFRYGHGEVLDGILFDGLTDSQHNFHMGICAEMCSKKYNISRADQDAFAIESYKRAIEATQKGYLKPEIVKVEIDQGKNPPLVVEADEELAKVKLDKVPSLKPAFQKDGTVTAANASSLNDGACALIVMSASKAKELGLKPLARILAFDDAAQEPENFTTAPSLAIPLALKRAKLNKSDVHFYEINQAFSVVSLANMKILDLDPAKVDVFGGAVALGHPIGMSGARIVGTLLNVLQQKDGTVGVASICNGGGGASAIVIERL
eukprot:c18323_g1_i1.p1 GENE.c18323_g1_i1~~c18323_g1_i1.p1  ORF type:complete len:438 (-),score=214.89 c18323_g1_i1:17-1279(-)